DCPRGIAVRADAHAFRSAVENVAANALEALQARGSGGTLALRAERHDGVVDLVVQDDGPGIPEEVRTRLLSPFSSGHRGSGLADAGVASALQDPELRYVEAVVADVVLGDGKVSGIELLGALRKQEVRAPVVLVTAFGDTQRLKAALNAGASYLLEKPFTTEALRQILDKVTTVDVDLARLVNRALSKARLTRKEEEVARLVLK